jgi:3'-phosphoadenosine 5'-phosphosulfate sulfotransferase (PAPS reductase)/FAD synthetase
MTRLKPTALRALAILQANDSVTTHDLLECGAGSRYGQRIAEIRALGHVIEAKQVRAGSWRYRLVSSPTDLPVAGACPTPGKGQSSVGDEEAPIRTGLPATGQSSPVPESRHGSGLAPSGTAHARDGGMSHTALRLLPSVDPDDLVAQVKAEHRPVGTVALFSGGHDSTVLAHRCQDHYERLAYIDTGTALPGVREFVVSFADWIGKPLTVLDSGSKYRDMVLGLGDQKRDGVAPLGFPGPAQHNRAYNQLKERQLRRLRAEMQEGHKRGARVLMLSGIRRGESRRRRSRPEVSFHGSIVFANPLIDWTDEDMRRYREENNLPESDVAALIHRSGECNCGSFAAPGEREMMASLWPEWFETTIASLEREAEALGISACRWGERPGVPVEAGPMCSDCQLQMDMTA